jgi:hypothetical protein
MHGERCTQQAHGTFHHAKGCQGASYRNGEFLGALFRHFNAVDARHFHHHLGIDRSRTEEVDTRQWIGGYDPCSDPAIAIDAPLRFADALLV